MAWIELHQNLSNHPKLIRLAARLEVDRIKALGHIVSLWLWALDYAEDGNLKGFGAVEIAAGAGWPGDPQQFLKALQDCRWMDKMAIHDWMDYAGRLVEKRVANRERMREKRARGVQRTTGARAGATIPNPTNQTNLTFSSEQKEIFEQARNAYPGLKRKTDRELADFGAAHGPTAFDILPLLLPAIRKYVAYLAKKTTADGKPAMVKAFRTWLAEEGWTTEYPGAAGAGDESGKAKAKAHFDEHGFYPLGTPNAWMAA